eukprot:GHVO01032339.1.p1 GENE.GHVO01032339.1~~GHVO01032339.1.p1  ORF type:complete len:149 (+),score=14.21 GHVO01032339.1:222-668(+)
MRTCQQPIDGEGLKLKPSDLATDDILVTIKLFVAHILAVLYETTSKADLKFLLMLFPGQRLYMIIFKVLTAIAKHKISVGGKEMEVHEAIKKYMSGESGIDQIELSDLMWALLSGGEQLTKELGKKGRMLVQALRYGTKVTKKAGAGA